MPNLVLVVSLCNSFMVSIIFIWEISQELSEPYQSAVTKVITCKDAVGTFFIHPPPFEWNLTTSLIRPVWSLLFVGFFFSTVIGKHKAKTKGWERKIGKHKAKTKGWGRKVPVILCCEILYQFVADCNRSKRAKGKAAWFLFFVYLWKVLNVAASKSQSWTKETLSL